MDAGHDAVQEFLDDVLEHFEDAFYGLSCDNETLQCTRSCGPQLVEEGAPFWAFEPAVYQP
ncbi:MAG: hypothetical protein JST92_02705 [Deltaproteobacteria bacterium]|nr:hypothetical protein [Deltaproteobacteria bacterium]